MCVCVVTTFIFWTTAVYTFRYSSTYPSQRTSRAGFGRHTEQEEGQHGNSSCLFVSSPSLCGSTLFSSFVAISTNSSTAVDPTSPRERWMLLLPLYSSSAQNELERKDVTIFCVILYILYPKYIIRLMYYSAAREKIYHAIASTPKRMPTNIKRCLTVSYSSILLYSGVWMIPLSFFSCFS